MNREQSGKRLRYLTVRDVAALLGVSVQTVRNWSEAGILRPIRHPINRYRLYDPQEVRKLARQWPRREAAAR